jgi:hypothetical protein
MGLTDRDVHRCQCGSWKLRRQDCTVCAIFTHEAALRDWRTRRAIAEAKGHADCISNRQAVLRGVA